MEINTFKNICKKNKPKKNVFLSSTLAFLMGGSLGVLSQLFLDLMVNYGGLSLKESMAYNSIIFIGATSLLTFLGWYNELGQIFGAGLFVPITGFANSVCSAALEFKFEGPIFGVGSKIFSLAGSVIIYGIITSFFYGVIRLLLSLVGVLL